MNAIPRCMSTQHPDNVFLPFFAENSELGGEDEIQEAFYAFSHLGCDEQMWDCEGKEVDNFVVKKLLTKQENFFKQTRLGKQVFLTLRIPNPSIERAEAKILLETLESIPRSFDAARMFYGDDISPIFEVILPMTDSAVSLERIYRYYKDFVVGKQHMKLGNGATIAEWIGKFHPETINVIPLFETDQYMLTANAITNEYLQNKKVEYQRVFIARSDPAMNYGMVSAVLLNKIALQRIHRLSKQIQIPLYPIIGVGSVPFRGNLRPQTVQHVLEEYPSVHTFTVQSSFKYDNSPESVRQAIQTLKNHITRDPHGVEEERALAIIKKYTITYRQQIAKLAPIINTLARFTPGRRKRKLHVGLFGYSRTVGTLSLPRAIPFTAALYSIGLPPEILGLNALTADDFAFLKTVYIHFNDDLKDALQFFNPNSPFLPPELASMQLPETEKHEEYRALTREIIQAFQENRTEKLHTLVLQAATIRKFLG